MTSLRAFVLSLAAVAAAAGPGRAGFITYTSSADFFAAVGGTPFVTEGYETYPIDGTIAPGTTLNGITYTAFPLSSDGVNSTLGRIDNLYGRIGSAGLGLQDGGDATSFFFPGESMTVTFASPVFAVGIFFNVVPSPAGSLFVQTPVGTTAAGGPTFDQGTLYFAGLISDTPFATATVGGTADAAGGFTLDDLTYTNALPPGVFTPVPPTLLAAVAGVGLLARFRRRAA